MEFHPETELQIHEINLSGNELTVLVRTKGVDHQAVLELDRLKKLRKSLEWINAKYHANPQLIEFYDRVHKACLSYHKYLFKTLRISFKDIKLKDPGCKSIKVVGRSALFHSILWELLNNIRKVDDNFNYAQVVRVSYEHSESLDWTKRIKTIKKLIVISSRFQKNDLSPMPLKLTILRAMQEHQGTCEIEILTPNTHEEIKKRLEHNDYQLIHFDTHGVTNAYDHQEKALRFGNSPETKFLLTEEELSGYLPDEPKAIFFSSCSSDWLDSNSTGFGIRLNRMGHYVICNKWPISDWFHRRFYQKFYQCISASQSLEEGVMNSLRQNLTSEDSFFQDRRDLSWLNVTVYTNDFYYYIDRNSFDLDEIKRKKTKVSPIFIEREAQMNEIREKLSKERLLNLFGEYGIGKTEFLKDLFYLSKSEDSRDCIFLDRKKHLKNTLKVLENRGNCLLILDFNFNDGKEVSEVKELVDDLLNTNSDARVLYSSNKQIEPGQNTFYLSPLNNDQTKTYIRTYFPTVGRAMERELSTDLQRRLFLALGGNPRFIDFIFKSKTVGELAKSLENPFKSPFFIHGMIPHEWEVNLDSLIDGIDHELKLSLIGKGLLFSPFKLVDEQDGLLDLLNELENLGLVCVESQEGEKFYLLNPFLRTYLQNLLWEVNRKEKALGKDVLNKSRRSFFSSLDRNQSEYHNWLLEAKDFDALNLLQNDFKNGVSELELIAFLSANRKAGYKKIYDKILATSTKSIYDEYLKQSDFEGLNRVRNKVMESALQMRLEETVLEPKRIIGLLRDKVHFDRFKLKDLNWKDSVENMGIESIKRITESTETLRFPRSVYFIRFLFATTSCYEFRKGIQSQMDEFLDYDFESSIDDLCVRIMTSDFDISISLLVKAMREISETDFFPSFRVNFPLICALIFHVNKDSENARKILLDLRNERDLSRENSLTKSRIELVSSIINEENRDSELLLGQIIYAWSSLSTEYKKSMDRFCYSLYGGRFRILQGDPSFAFKAYFHALYDLKNEYYRLNGQLLLARDFIENEYYVYALRTFLTRYWELIFSWSHWKFKVLPLLMIPKLLHCYFFRLSSKKKGKAATLRLIDDILENSPLAKTWEEWILKTIIIAPG